MGFLAYVQEFFHDSLSNDYDVLSSIFPSLQF